MSDLKGRPAENFQTLRRRVAFDQIQISASDLWLQVLKFSERENRQIPALLLDLAYDRDVFQSFARGIT